MHCCVSFFVQALFLLAPFWGWSQPVDIPQGSALHYGARLHRGFIIAHSRELIDVSHSKPLGFELNLHWLLQSEKQVRQSGLYAKRGFAAFFINFQNPEVLGYSVAFVPYVEPLIRPWKRFHGSLQVGLGAAYVSKVYDKEDNPTNLFFSLPVSLWAMVNAHLHYKIQPKWTLSAGFNYNHISNGGMKNPNKGMNFPTFNAGVQYALKDISLRRPIKNSDWKNQPRNFQYILLVGSIKNVPSEPGFPQIEPGVLAGVQWMWGRRMGRLSAISLGTEWIFDGYDRIVLDRRADPNSTWKGGILIGHELLAGRVRFSTHIGPYVYNPSRITDPVYQRYGLFYRFGKHLLVGSTLKAHRHVADVFDLRVGYLW